MHSQLKVRLSVMPIAQYFKSPAGTLARPPALCVFSVESSLNSLNAWIVAVMPQSCTDARCFDLCSDVALDQSMHRITGFLAVCDQTKFGQ